jgi:hypothetical protein
MMMYKIKFLFRCIFLLLFTQCITLAAEPVKTEANAEKRPSCYILFDAGSSGTRLYVYEKQSTGWFEHVGPKVGALADPVREFRGKKHSDIDAVTSEVVATLDDMKEEGPFDEKKGKNKWKAFDWSKQCHILGAMVYGTAGMRIAEQKNREKSSELLTVLKQKLQEKVGDAVKVSTRTLADYEEGLYAWLTVREYKKHNNFGIVEMGGASTQVTFPCPTCDASDDATRMIMVNGSPLQIYSYSFMGMGQDESPKTLGIPESCAYGIGTTHPHWKESDCAEKIVVAEAKGIRDPYNFSQGQQGTHRIVPTQKAAVSDWYLTGTFNDMDDNRIETCCVNTGECPVGESACFRPVYFNKYLKTLNIPKSAEKMDVSWTLGAVLCTTENCLQKAAPLVCRWSEKGCL